MCGIVGLDPRESLVVVIELPKCGLVAVEGAQLAAEAEERVVGVIDEWAERGFTDAPEDVATLLGDIG